MSLTFVLLLLHKIRSVYLIKSRYSILVRGHGCSQANPQNNSGYIEDFIFAHPRKHSTPVSTVCMDEDEVRGIHESKEVMLHPLCLSLSVWNCFNCFNFIKLYTYFNQYKRKLHTSKTAAFWNIITVHLISSHNEL